MPQIDEYQASITPDGTLITCDICPYFLLLTAGEPGYDANLPLKGRCLFGPPPPNGTYPGELGQYPLVMGNTHYGCARHCNCLNGQP